MTRRLLLTATFGALLAGCGSGETSSDDAQPTNAVAGKRPGSKSWGPPDSTEAIAENNRGVALMGRFEYGPARRVFQKLSETYPDWLDVRVNLAIAALNEEQGGETALGLLGNVLEANPGHIAANYCTALLMFHHGRLNEALPFLRKLSAADDEDPYVPYLIAECLKGQSDADAIEWYRKAIECDSRFRSAYYGLSILYRRRGSQDAALKLLDVFEQLKQDPRAFLFEVKYTRMGPKAQAIAVDLATPHPVASPDGPLFQEPAPLIAGGDADLKWSIPPDRRPASITAADLDADGRVDLLILTGVRESGDETLCAVCRVAEDGTVTLLPDHPLASVTGVNAALWGDYDNDGFADVYLCRRGPNQLWRQTSPDQWEPVTDSTQTSGGETDTVDGLIFDADHDGDLDVFLVNADAPNELLNNDRDGTFRPIAATAGIAGDGRPSRGIVVADLDGDRDCDLVVLHEQPPHDVFLNELGWDYRRSEQHGRLAESQIVAAVAGDVNSDGQIELYSIGPDGLVRWEPDAKGDWQSAVLAGTPAAKADDNARLSLCDVTGDGRLELLAGTGAKWHVLDLRGAAASPLASFGDDVSGWAAVVLSARQGPAVVAVQGDEPVIWAPGAGRHAFLAVSLAGNERGKDQVRSNASGRGARVEARVDSRWTVVDYLRADSGPGQSLQPVALGLGGQASADFVRVCWPDGVSQSEIDLAVGKWHHIEEKDRMPSSCPVLFAWNGREYAFVSDLLGVGGLGYLIAPGQYAAPDPTENFLMPDGAIAPRDGRFALKLAEPMEELTCLDFVGLSAWDLPPGWRMTLDERMGTGEPPPTGEPKFFRQWMSPVLATNDRHDDVTHTVRHADGNAAPPGELDPRFIGRLHREHMLQLKFPRPLDSAPGEPVLIADGWVEYPYSQTVFAAWQAGAGFRPPTLEARDDEGRWRVVLHEFGYPAGMPRQMSVPLRDLPPGTTEIRLRTNQEVYWDRLQIAWSEPCPQARRTRLKLAAADLRESGFMPRILREQRRPSFDYNRRTPLAETRDPAGWYTRFGAVSELIDTADDAVAIFGPGEEVHIEFSAPAVGPPPGWTRCFVLETVGWCKDMDLYTGHGETVGPLPTSGPQTQRRRELHETYNTRYQSGR